MSDPPSYYIHAGKSDNSASSYRITTPVILAILGYHRFGRTDERIAHDLIEGTPDAEVSSDVRLWRETHQEEAQAAYSLFRPDTVRLGVGLCVNGKYPWLACLPGDFTWAPDGSMGQTNYIIPFSQRLPKDPSSISDIRLAVMSGVTEWTRPQIDRVIWTPTGSSLKSYTPQSVLVEAENITLFRLWNEFIWPRVTGFYEGVLKPALIARGLSPDQLYEPDPQEYIAVRNPKSTPEDLIKAFGAL